MAADEPPLVGKLVRDEATRAFLEGTDRGEFLIRRCRRCFAASEPHVQTCPVCFSTELDWEAASGHGSLVSWSVIPPRTEDNTGQPFVVAVVELAEGPWWWSQLVGVDPLVLVAGLPVQVGFERHGEYEAIPVFRPGLW
jgi:uncharacterized OB-fold protein